MLVGEQYSVPSGLVIGISYAHMQLPPMPTDPMGVVHVELHVIASAPGVPNDVKLGDKIA